MVSALEANSLGRVWVAGHTGMVGSALCRKLEYSQNLIVCTRNEVDLTRQRETEDWLSENKPDTIFLCAARVGGIYANSKFPADFIYQNLAIQTNVIEAARRCRVNRLIFLGSSCTYPKLAPQPISEDQLMCGQPEITNVWYATAKLAGVKMIEAYRAQYGLEYITAMPTNCYGPGDNFDRTSSHVIPSLMNKIHSAKARNLDHVEIWGTGRPIREFIYVDDLADALVFLASFRTDQSIFNVGSSNVINIRNLAILISRIIGYDGQILFDTTMPDGAMRKELDSRRINELGWSPKTELHDGIARTYEWYKEQFASTDD